MWRVYNSKEPTNILSPSLKIEKGDKIILDTDYQINRCKYYITYQRGDKKPIKFEITDKTWAKLADRSNYP